MIKDSEPRLLVYDPSDFETPWLDELRELYGSSVPDYVYYDFRNKRPFNLRDIDRLASQMIKSKVEDEEHDSGGATMMRPAVNTTRKEKQTDMDLDELWEAIPDEATAEALVEQMVCGGTSPAAGIARQTGFIG